MTTGEWACLISFARAFHFEFFACFPSLQVGGALANEIKHDHSPIVIVVLEPTHDHSKEALCIY